MATALGLIDDTCNPDDPNQLRDFLSSLDLGTKNKIQSSYADEQKNLIVIDSLQSDSEKKDTRETQSSCNISQGRIAHHILIKTLVRCQGVLAQFENPQVRKLFIDGHFAVKPNSYEALQSIDKIREILLPKPSSVLFDEYKTVSFVEKLLSRSSIEVADLVGNSLPYRQSYSQWRVYLNCLILSKGWINVLKGTEELRQLRRNSPNKFETEHEIDVDSFSNLNMSSRARPKSGFHELRGQMQSSSSSSDSESTSSTMQSRYSNSSRNSSKRRNKYDVRGSRDIIKVLEHIGRPKEVMAPVPFDVGDTRSLSKFLGSFERYFESRFEGTQRERSLYLGKLLRGPARSAYDAMGGSSMKYSKLKIKLLDWFDSQKTNRSDISQAEFARAVMADGDTCSIYCLRLEKLADAAFRDSPREKSRQLERKLKETAPSALVKKLHDAQSILTVTSEEKLTWSKMKRLAEEHDRVASEGLRDTNNTPGKDLDFSTLFSKLDPLTSTSPPLRNYGGNQTTAQSQRGRFQRPRVFRGGQRSSSTGSRFIPRSSVTNQERTSPERIQYQTQGRTPCTWCGRTGHRIDNCWERMGACMACGSDTHKVNECPRRRQPQQTVLCPMCGGQHLGKDCQSQTREENANPLND